MIRRPRRDHRGFPSATRRRSVAAAAAAIVIGGCTGSPPPTPEAAQPPPPPPASLAPAVREEENRIGIEVRQWLVEADAALVASTIAAWADDATREDDGETASTLRLEEGVSIATGPASELVAVLAALGGTRTDLRIWHGQALEWRDLAGVNLSRSTIAVAGGRPLAIPPGRLSLQMRGWVQAMEHGAACEVELAMRWKPERRVSIGLDATPADAASWIGDLAALRSVERGRLLLITPTAAGPTTPAGGPPVETPPTLGELVLGSPAPGFTTVLVVWPSLPGYLHPGGEDPDAEDSAEG